MSEIVLSGIRASGRLHFGNLLGAVSNFVRFQRPGNTCLYFVADWHTLTTPQDAEGLKGNLIEMVKDYLAAGLDPERSIIYAQSSVPEIAELCLYLSMLQPLPELLKVPTYKELVRRLLRKGSGLEDQVLSQEEEQKIEEGREGTLGLVTYPVLMAADILGPKSTLIPVGSDQVPNVELARSLARKFNARFGETFIIPRMMEEMVMVPGLNGEKMGKSDADNAIDLNMPIAEIRKRYLERGITDPERKRSSDPGNPYNRCKSVYPVHELVTAGEAKDRTIAKLCMNAQIGCVECKHRLVDSLAKVLGPFLEARAYFADRDDHVREVLHEGGKKARALIAPTVAQVRDKMGIVLY